MNLCWLLEGSQMTSHTKRHYLWPDQEMDQHLMSLMTRSRSHYLMIALYSLLALCLWSCFRHLWDLASSASVRMDQTKPLKASVSKPSLTDKTIPPKTDTVKLDDTYGPWLQSIVTINDPTASAAKSLFSLNSFLLMRWCGLPSDESIWLTSYSPTSNRYVKQ